MAPSSQDTDSDEVTDPPPIEEPLLAFVRRIGAQADAAARHVADTTDIRDAVGVLVRHGPVVAELTRDEFYAVFDRNDTGLFDGCIEAYALADTVSDATAGDIVLQVTFPDGETASYTGQVSDLAFLLGRGTDEGWVVGHLDETVDVFDERTLQYMRSRYLFDSTGKNRSTELCRDDEIRETLRSDTFQQALAALCELPEDERHELLEKLRDDD